MKKIKSLLIISLIIGPFAFFGIKKALMPHLIPTALKITNLIHEKENKKDCTCWSTVRLMEYHQSELPMNYEATVIKIESMKALIAEIWKNSSNKNISFKESLNNILTPNFPEWTQQLNTLPSDLNNETYAKTQKYHYHQLTEHYRYILSIIYDLSNFNHSTKNYRELSNNDIQQLALVSTHLNEALLKSAKDSAFTNKHNRIEMDDIQIAFSNILSKLNLEKSQPEEEKAPFLYNFWLKKISTKIVKNKIKSLKNYNSTLWNEKNVAKTQAYLLSKIFDLDIKPDEVNTISNVFIKNYLSLFYDSSFQRIDTHMLNHFDNKTTSSEDLSYKIQSFKQLYEKLLNQLPILLQNNGDIKVIFKILDDQGLYSSNDTIEVNDYTLDAIRDTVVHWMIIDKVMNTRRISIIDPFGLELLAERISEYFGVILTKTKESKIPLNQMISNYNLLDNEFNQLNNQESTWKKTTPLNPKHYFKKIHDIDTTFFSFTKNQKALEIFNGYFSGISTVDIDNDNDIDILISSHDGHKIAYNNGNNNYETVQLFRNTDTRTSAAYAIDINYDYLLDILLVTYDGIKIFEQKNNAFKETQTIDLKYPFMLCSNDIDNDGDLDFYITRLSGEFPSLDGRNALPNKLYKISSANTFIDSNKKSVESVGFGLACSIVDINNDDLNDILVINDFGRDELFIQTKTGFKNKAKKLRFDDAGSGMNLSIIDFNQDEYWDIYITMIDMFNKQISFELPLDKTLLPFTDYIQKTSTFIIGNQLYIGSKKEYERKTEDVFEPGQKGWGWGTSFFDYNNNGLNDIYITNGHFIPPGFENNKKPSNSEKNIFMINKNNKFLYSHSLSEESTLFHNSRAISSADLNNDGNIDLVLRNFNQVILYENSSDQNLSWLKIKLIGNDKNTFAIGSIIEVITKERRQKKIVLAETGFLTQEPYVKHFGLNNMDIESIKVTWPDKKVSIISSPIKSNQKIMVYFDQTSKDSYEKTVINNKNKPLSIIANFDNVKI